LAIERFEQLRHERANQPPSLRRTRPAVYIPASRLRRLQRRNQTAHSNALPQVMLPRGATVVWSCEVEPHIWMPYDAEVTSMLERAFSSGRDRCSICVAGTNFVVVFRHSNGSMVQVRAAPASATSHPASAKAPQLDLTNGSRPVQRVIIPPVEEMSRFIQRMDLQQLRDFIASAQNGLSPEAFYEALGRLHELDREPVVVAATVVSSFPRVAFGAVLQQVASGVDYRGFGNSCAICLEEYTPETQLVCLPGCSHLFHETCITEYLRRFSRNCPVCKAEVS